LSHEIRNVEEAETLGPSKATWAASRCEMPSLRRGRRPHHVRKGTRRNLRGLMFRPQAAEPTGPHREGEEPKPMMHGHEKSDSAIVATKPPNKGRVTGRGGGGAKGGGQGEHEPLTHVPDTGPGKACLRRRSAYGRPRGQPSTSEVGAVCGQAAGTVLCRGRSVMGVPTAILPGCARMSRLRGLSG
jgi:hypothetical protein